MNQQNLAKIFHRQSTEDWRSFGIPEEKNWPEEWKKIEYKSYSRFPTIKLESVPLPVISLESALNKRETYRDFDPNSKITFLELSSVLHYSAGLKSTKSLAKRYYPSGGARYPLEFYIVAERVDGLKKGLYHYNVKEDCVETLLELDDLTLFKKMLGYDWSRKASASIIISAVWNRTLSKYRDFGYKLLCMEAGHVSQNIQLVSQALKINCASVAGFKEKEIDKWLNLDSENESSIYLSVIGR